VLAATGPVRFAEVAALVLLRDRRQDV